MKSNTVNIEKHQDPWDRLQTLLEKQVRMSKNSNIRGVEMLAEQANSVVAEITNAPSPLPPQWKQKCEAVMQLYKKLELMIEAEKDTVNKQLRKVTSGKKAVRAYHHGTERPSGPENLS
jgi:hypothetical protein